MNSELNAVFGPSPAPGAFTSNGEAHASGLQPTLLNVEDYEPSRFLRTRIFRAAGYQVGEAASAAEALAAAARQMPSIALIDVNLPDSDGIALCDTLKRLHPRLAVLLISAVSASPDTIAVALSVGAEAYLRDPIDGDVLVGRADQALARLNSEVEPESWLVTDPQGVILDASPEAARLLSGTRRGLQQRSLIVFFEQEREAWRAAMTRASLGDRVTRSGRLRPKERRPITVRARIAQAVDWGRPALLWTFEEADSK